MSPVAIRAVIKEIPCPTAGVTRNGRIVGHGDSGLDVGRYE